MGSSARIAWFGALSALVDVSLATDAAGTEFLRANSAKEGVVTLESGLQYKILRRGYGDSHPAVDSSCECHYQGQMAKDYGTDVFFDSSYQRGSPTSFAPNQVIKGWTEAMQLMVEGDKWELFIPAELGYGARGSPPAIGPDSALVFTMEIISIDGAKVPASPRCNVGTLEGCSDKEAEFIAKHQARSAEERAAEAKRLEGLIGARTTPDKIAWMRSRLALLRAIVKAVEKQEL